MSNIEENLSNTSRETTKKDMKKQVIKTIAGTIVLSLIGSGVYFGYKVHKENNFKRITLENGEYDL